VQQAQEQPPPEAVPDVKNCARCGGDLFFRAVFDPTTSRSLQFTRCGACEQIQWESESTGWPGHGCPPDRRRRRRRNPGTSTDRPDRSPRE